MSTPMVPNKIMNMICSVLTVIPLGLRCRLSFMRDRPRRSTGIR